MVGGVLSTMVVGVILDKGDLYANLAAESYLQSSDDEEFWKGLSEEERKKTEDVINKIKKAKGEAPAEATVVAAVSESAASTSESAETKPAELSSTPKDMFSDYGD
jgi:KaiC/GvpD/RAD55 family RecA-like ATPase